MDLKKATEDLLDRNTDLEKKLIGIGQQAYCVLEEASAGAIGKEDGAADDDEIGSFEKRVKGLGGRLAKLERK
jgi:hypothetical protein